MTCVSTFIAGPCQSREGLIRKKKSIFIIFDLIKKLSRYSRSKEKANNSILKDIMTHNVQIYCKPNNILKDILKDVMTHNVQIYC